MVVGFEAAFAIDPDATIAIKLRAKNFLNILILLDFLLEYTSIVFIITDMYL